MCVLPQRRSSYSLCSHHVVPLITVMLDIDDRTATRSSRCPARRRGTRSCSTSTTACPASKVSPSVSACRRRPCSCRTRACQVGERKIHNTTTPRGRRQLGRCVPTYCLGRKIGAHPPSGFRPLQAVVVMCPVRFCTRWHFHHRLRLQQAARAQHVAERVPSHCRMASGNCGLVGRCHPGHEAQGGKSPGAQLHDEPGLPL